MDKKRIRKLLKWTVFFVYIASLVYFMFFAEMLGRADAVSTYRYNLVPFKEIKRFLNNCRHLGMEAVLANIAGNVIAFMPFGFCIPMITDHRRKFIGTAFGTLVLSLSIELIQLVSKVGCCDVDDVILNTLGGILGYVAYVMFKLCRKAMRHRKNSKHRK